MTGSRRFPALSAVVPVLLVLMLALWFSGTQQVIFYRDWNQTLRPTWHVEPGKGIVESEADIDTVLIHGGLELAPRFRDTLRWWVGTWAGPSPFYRPLSSYVMWTEWKLFDDHEARYNFCALLLHLCAVYQLVRLAQEFAERFALPCPPGIAFLTGLIFLDGLWMFTTNSTTRDLVSTVWKNQPDSLCAVFFCLSLRAYLRQRVSQTPRRAAIASLLFYLAACASKEAGVVLPLLLLPLEWGQNTGLNSPSETQRPRADEVTPAPQKSRLASLSPALRSLLLALPLFWIFRAVCLGTFLGYRYGTNKAWLMRTLSVSFGPVSVTVTLERWAALAVGVCGAVLVGTRLFRGAQEKTAKKSYLPMLALSGGVILVLALIELPETSGSDALPIRMAVALLQYTQPIVLTESLGVGLFLLAVRGAWRTNRRVSLFCAVWVLTALSMIAVSPGPLHRYYLLGMGYALWAGVGLVAAFAPLLTRLTLRSKE